ncbi:MAG: ribose-5-phosphate isomerase RpiA [Thermoleophilaceae bacterium]
MTPAIEEQTLAREAAARAAADRIQPGQMLGFGSGRAVWKVIELLGERAPERAVAASTRTEERLREAGIEPLSIDDAGRIDLVIDGADELDRRLNLIKGGGGAHLREKLLAEAASDLLVVAETPKLVDRLGTHWGMPVEIVRFGWLTTRARLVGICGSAERRADDRGQAFVTDEGNWIVDCAIPAGADLEELAAAIKAETGVIEHGLFLGMASAALLGTPDGRVETISA